MPNTCTCRYLHEGDKFVDCLSVNYFQCTRISVEAWCLWIFIRSFIFCCFWYFSGNPRLLLKIWCWTFALLSLTTFFAAIFFCENLTLSQAMFLLIAAWRMNCCWNVLYSLMYRIWLCLQYWSFCALSSLLIWLHASWDLLPLVTVNWKMCREVVVPLRRMCQNSPIQCHVGFEHKMNAWTQFVHQPTAPTNIAQILCTEFYMQTLIMRNVVSCMIMQPKFVMFSVCAQPKSPNSDKKFMWKETRKQHMVKKNWKRKYFDMQSKPPKEERKSTIRDKLET